jgi:hypothetical protein
MIALDRLLIGCILAVAALVAGTLQVRHYGAERYAAGQAAAVAAGAQLRARPRPTATTRPKPTCARNWPRMMKKPTKPRGPMKSRLKLLSAACAMALTACAAQQPAQYQPAARPQIDPLPADLQLTYQDRNLCRKLLLTFSATPQQLQDSCGDISASSSGSKRAGQ